MSKKKAKKSYVKEELFLDESSMKASLYQQFPELIDERKMGDLLDWASQPDISFKKTYCRNGKGCILVYIPEIKKFITVFFEYPTK